MDITREEQQRDEFRGILLELAESQLSLKEKGDRSRVYQRLEKLYYSPDSQEGFRHFYSDIFAVLTQIQSGTKQGSIDILGQNLLEIRKGYQVLNTDENGKPVDIRDSIRKLYDHVSLDIARIQYSDAADRKLAGTEALSAIRAKVNQMERAVETDQQKQSDLRKEFEKQKREQSEYEKKLTQIQSNIENAETAQKKVENELASQQREYIAILGIFAAVVLAFTAGIAFSTSVLENISGVSIYRMAGITLLIGIVLTNILFGLFYYIDRLVNGRKDRRITPLWLANGIFILLLIMTLIAWAIGLVEIRSNRIEDRSEGRIASDVWQYNT